LAQFKRITPLLVARRISQVAVATVLFNSYFKVFQTRRIYAGPIRQLCIPGLSCHACPSAVAGCPIGMLQHFAAAHSFPFYLIGFLGLIGLTSGRFTCGWLCPFGLLQDVSYAFKRLTVRIPKLLNYGKYVVLLVLAIIIPYITNEHWFSKLCPCGALIAGIPWALWNPTDPVFGIAAIAPESIGTLFWVKLTILGVFLILFLLIKRPFCRTICPLGAIYSLFNRISLVSLKQASICQDCGKCRELCPVDLEARTEINSANCIKCLDCLQCKHVKFAWNLPWKSKPPEALPVGLPGTTPQAAVSESSAAD
jgi:polyferredoxin